MPQAALFRGPRLLSKAALLVSASFCFVACEGDQTVLEVGGARSATGGRDGTQWQMAADRSGQVSDAGPKRTSPLANVANLATVPSQPGPHIEKIKALGDNEWLKLGSPAADPKWGKARGKTWSAKMPAAPNLRGGFLAGQGPHGYIKPDGPDAGFLDDDIWFYDINAHRWICIYPGTNTATFTQQVKNGQIKAVNGQVLDEGGQPIPLVVLLHAWGNVTYNSDESTFAFYNAGWNGGPFLTPPAVAEGLNLLIAQGNGSVPGSPWFYRAREGRFDSFPVKMRVENRSEGASNQLLYITSKKQYLSIGRDGIFRFDPLVRQWVDSGASGPNTVAVDNAAAYDPTRDRVYFGGGGYTPQDTTPGDNFFIYEVKTNKRSRPYPQGNFPLTFASNDSFFNYDSTNDVAVLMSGFGRAIFIYTPDTNTWVTLPLTMPEELVNTIVNRYAQGSGFYDPVLNAFFFHFARNGLTDGIMWVYRYKKAKP